MMKLKDTILAKIKKKLIVPRSVDKKCFLGGRFGFENSIPIDPVSQTIY